MCDGQPIHSDLFHQVLNVDWDLVASRAKSHPHEARYEDDLKRTPLHLACLLHSLPFGIITCLLDAFPQATMKRTKWGATPLHFACLYSDSEVVKMLLEANIDAMHVKDADGFTPFLCMSKWFEFNFRRGLANMTKNSQEGFPGAVQRCITRQKDPELDRLWKNTCLLTSAYYYGTSQEVNSCSLHHFAGIYPCPGVVFDFALAVQRNDLYKKDLKGNLPLHVALSSQCSQDESRKRDSNEKSMIEKLIDAHPLGAKVANYEGDLPLHLAIRTRRGFRDILKILKAFPGAAAVMDCKSRLYPFMSAAEGEYFSLDVAFFILCLCPELDRFTG